MKQILIAGGSGLIGKALTKLLKERNYNVAILSRTEHGDDGVKRYYWNPRFGEIDENAIIESDIIVNFAGSNLSDERWTKKHKKAIRNSRVDSVNLLLKLVKKHKPNLEAFVGTSAIGYYGSCGNALLTEDSPAGNGFLAEVCKDWEAAYQLEDTSIRKVVFRTGIVLCNQGGALMEMVKTLPFFVGILGKGQQIYSWIHMLDMVNMIIYAIENDTVSGIYNAVAPNPVSQETLAKSIAQIKGARTIVTPELALKVVLGEMSDMVLMSQNCSADKIKNAGFHFTYENASKALESLFVKSPSFQQ